ncbi:MAG TPA: DUF883 C-terminal domain-containing protein [Blastocatellia bacterium]
MAERDDLTSTPYPYSQGQGRETISGAERSAEEIRQDIAARRESITDTVDRLSDRFQQTLDWKAYVSEHPLAAIGVAAGLGFLAFRISSRIFKPRRTAGKRIKDVLAYGIEDLAGRFHHQLENVAPYRSRSGLGGALKAAAAGLITKAATGYLQNKVAGRFAGQVDRYPEHEPEYESEYEKRGYERDSELFR